MHGKKNTSLDRSRLLVLTVDLLKLLKSLLLVMISGKNLFRKIIFQKLLRLSQFYYLENLPFERAL